MKKTWHNPRQIVIHQVPVESENSKRLERLISLLAIGMERFMATDDNTSSALLDFTPNVLPNTCTGKETTKMENA